MCLPTRVVALNSRKPCESFSNATMLIPRRTRVSAFSGMSPPPGRRFGGAGSYPYRPRGLRWTAACPRHPGPRVRHPGHAGQWRIVVGHSRRLPLSGGSGPARGPGLWRGRERAPHHSRRLSVRFLIDAQLPPGLAQWLTASGYPSDHVDDLGLGAARDDEIEIRARETGGGSLVEGRRLCRPGATRSGIAGGLAAVRQHDQCFASRQAGPASAGYRRRSEGRRVP